MRKKKYPPSNGKKRHRNKGKKLKYHLPGKIHPRRLTGWVEKKK